MILGSSKFEKYEAEKIIPSKIPSESTRGKEHMGLMRRGKEEGLEKRTDSGGSGRHHGRRRGASGGIGRRCASAVHSHPRRRRRRR